MDKIRGMGQVRRIPALELQPGIVLTDFPLQDGDNLFPDLLQADVTQSLPDCRLQKCSA